MAAGKLAEPGTGLLARWSLPLDAETHSAELVAAEAALAAGQGAAPDQVDPLVAGERRATAPPDRSRDVEPSPRGGASDVEAPPAGGHDAAVPGSDLVEHDELAGTGEPGDELGVAVASRRRVLVYQHADVGSTQLGYLSSGAVVGRRGAQRAGRGCAGGFHAIEPTGFVCADEVSTDPEHVLAQALVRRPNRRSALPYRYGRSRRTPPPLYNRIPTAEEQRRSEPELSKYRFVQTPWRDITTDPVPRFLELGQPSLRFDGTRRSPLAVSAGRPIGNSVFALLDLFEVEGRYFGLSTDLSILPLDHLEPVEPSRFSGIALRNGVSLPVAFTLSRNARLFTRSQSGALTLARPLLYREAVALTGERETSGGRTLLEAQGGYWLLETSDLVVVDRRPTMPHFAKRGAKWLDVSIERQALVAYEGEVPVYATLVSTGRDGLGDPESSLSTVRGDFRVHTKHVSATMASDVEGDEYDLRDVPYVQYFSGNYALHGAFWHDAFGSPRSHGCINLSPLDARWVFDWTEPRVPEQWHGSMSLLRGTRVSIRP